MELCEKGDLFDYKHEIERRKRMDLVLSIAKGMEYLHKKNIVHRDLKTQVINFSFQ